jgi:predicted metal-binding membrane protein
VATALRRLTWRRPEWPWALAVAGAWLVLAWEGMRPAVQGMHYSMPGMSVGSGGPHELSGLGLGWWMLMAVAMMLPAALPLLREISLQSLWRRRYRSSALFLAGYLALWTVFGAAALAAWHAVEVVAPSTPAALVTGALFIVAAAWGVTATKRRCLKRCHRYLPLPPRGRAADAACLHFGLYNGRQCVAVCWPLMLATVPSHSLAPMLGATALLTWERLARLPRLHVCAFALAVTGGLVVYVAA